MPLWDGFHNFDYHFPPSGQWRLYNKIESPVLFQYHIISFNPANLKINNLLVHTMTIRMSTLITALQFTVPRGVFSAETSEKRHLFGRLWIGICHGVGDTVDRTARLQRIPKWWPLMGSSFCREEKKSMNLWKSKAETPHWLDTLITSS